MFTLKNLTKDKIKETKMPTLKYKATLVKIYTDGEGKIHNFKEVDVALETLDDLAENDLILNAYVINNINGEIIGLDEAEDENN